MDPQRPTPVLIQDAVWPAKVGFVTVDSFTPSQATKAITLVEGQLVQIVEAHARLIPAEDKDLAASDPTAWWKTTAMFRRLTAIANGEARTQDAGDSPQAEPELDLVDAPADVLTPVAANDDANTVQIPEPVEPAVAPAPLDDPGFVVPSVAPAPAVVVEPAAAPTPAPAETAQPAASQTLVASPHHHQQASVPRWPIWLAAISAVVVAAASMSLSFAATAALAVRVGATTPGLSWLVPIAIDGGLLACSASLSAWAAAGKVSRRPMLATVGGAGFLLISAYLNAAHASPTPLARFIAALAPISLMVSIELALTLRRHTHHEPRTPESDPAFNRP